ncbi:MAG: hypothetical protein Q8M29_07550 [Bacteroidota bacterium]|nr:hypothetical protein [Bacteroidota bacterium]
MKKAIILAIVYSIICIGFKLGVFYSGMLEQPLGRLSHLITLALILPFVILTIYMVKKSNGGTIGGKEAVRQGLTFVSFAAGIMIAFDYFFFVQEMQAYLQAYVAKTDYNALYKEAVKHTKGITMFEVVREQLKYERYVTTYSVTRLLFGYMSVGLFSSFVAGVFMKRA